jgi:hypothetical protein
MKAIKTVGLPLVRLAMLNTRYSEIVFMNLIENSGGDW